MFNGNDSSEIWLVKSRREEDPQDSSKRKNATWETGLKNSGVEATASSPKLYPKLVGSELLP